MDATEHNDISHKIKSLRKKRSITIQDLAEKTDLTPGRIFIQNRKQHDPASDPHSSRKSSLRPRRSCFVLLRRRKSAQWEGYLLSKKNERKQLIGDYTPLGYQYEAVIRKIKDINIKPLIVTLPYGLDSAEIPYNYHDGNELIYVLSGKVIFHYDDEKYPVAEGDCLYFDSRDPA